jgi:hypothetical protein
MNMLFLTVVSSCAYQTHFHILKHFITIQSTCILVFKESSPISKGLNPQFYNNKCHYLYIYMCCSIMRMQWSSESPFIDKKYCSLILYFSILLHFFGSLPFFYASLLAGNRISKKTQKKTWRKTAQEQNTNEKHAECHHIKKGSEPKKQRSRILEYMKNPTPLKLAM